MIPQEQNFKQLAKDMENYVNVLLAKRDYIEKKAIPFLKKKVGDSASPIITKEKIPLNADRGEDIMAQLKLYELDEMLFDLTNEINAKIRLSQMYFHSAKEQEARMEAETTQALKELPGLIKSAREILEVEKLPDMLRLQAEVIREKLSEIVKEYDNLIAENKMDKPMKRVFYLTLRQYPVIVNNVALGMRVVTDQPE